MVGRGLVAMMPGTILIPPSAVALASHDPGVSDGYGQSDGPEEASASGVTDDSEMNRC